MKVVSILQPDKLQWFIENGLKEDIQDGDHTSEACISPTQTSRARLIVKDDGVIAGIEIAKKIFEYLDPDAQIEVIKNDGEEVSFGDVAFKVECQTHALLKGERLALNTMQRLSGIATLSRKFYNESLEYKTEILDTRKTTPLLRFLEKWAVAIGGCTNYRDGLYDRIMIKDNHIDAAGSITSAVRSVTKYLKEKNLDLDITVEVRNMKELAEVLDLDINPRVMLDNFSVSNLKKAVHLVGGKLETEASGGIRLNDVKKVASTGVDYISVGALTHSAQCLDLSLKIIK